jgi:hypothetical protein
VLDVLLTTYTRIRHIITCTPQRPHSVPQRQHAARRPTCTDWPTATRLPAVRDAVQSNAIANHHREEREIPSTHLRCSGDAIADDRAHKRVGH